MGKIITSSSNISILDSKILVNLCDGVFRIDLTPTTFIGVGANNALGAKVRITNPYNVPIKNFGTSFDIASPFTSVFEFNISTGIGGVYEYGEFTVDVQITDADNATYTVTKLVEPCYPDAQNKSRNYGSIGASIKGICKDARVLVAVDSLPTYNGILSSGVSQSFTLEYPTGSSLPVATRTSNYFSDYLFEGVYVLNGEICATYNGADNISYQVKYKVHAKKEIFCQIDDCAVFANFKALHTKLEGNCKEDERIEISNKLLEALSLYNIAKLANECGEDASDYIKTLEGLLGCKCTCNSGSAPITNTTPATDIVIEGCNITESVDGLTRHYKIDNYDYVVEVAENGGYLAVGSPQLANCTSKQTLTFDIAKVYTQIKNYANSDITEANFWSSIINKPIIGSPPPPGVTQQAWDAMTLVQRIEAILAYIASVQGSIPTIPAAPDVPPTPTFTNGTTVLAARNGATPAVVGLGSALTQDTFIDGGYRLAFTQARVGIGKVPVFPFDIQCTDPNFNLVSNTTMAMPLANGHARIANFSALQILGVTFTANQSNQAAAVTGQTVFYNSGLHQLNQYTNYAGTVGILIGYAGGTVTGSVIAALSAITMVGNGGSYDEIAGLRITAPQGSNFPDAANFSGTVNNYYSICIDIYSPASFPDGQIVNRWGLYQKGNESHRLGGKIVWDATAGGAGAQTINKPAGTFIIAAGSTSVTITNNMVTANSMVHVELGSVVVVGDNSPTAPAITVVAIEANGSFTAFLSATQAVPMKIKFIVYN